MLVVPAAAEACASCISSPFGDQSYNWPYLVLILVPFANDIGEAHAAGKQCMEMVYSLYMRILADLVQRAQETEASLGLEPLPEVESNE